MIAGEMETLSLICSVVGGILNMILDYVFIAGFDMGIGGDDHNVCADVCGLSRSLAGGSTDKTAKGGAVMRTGTKCCKKITEEIRIFLLLYAIYFMVCCIVPPLFHKKADEGEAFRRNTDPGGREWVLCLDDNTEALIWRLRMIEEAQEELILSTFDFRADNSGQDVMAALYGAAQRGVKVRIIVDGIPGTFFLRGDRTFRALVSHPNVEAKLYNPLNLLTAWKINYRMHDKYLIVDDTAFILGGRNLNDLFLGDYREKQNIDRDILVCSKNGGGCHEQLREYFEKIWEMPCSMDFVCHRDGDREKPCRETLESAGGEKWGRYGKERRLLQERCASLPVKWPKAYLEVNWQKELMEAEQVFLLTNPTEAKNKSPQMWRQLCRLMEKGERIFVETPYMICDTSMYREIAVLAGEDRQIQILLNAPEGGANPFGCADYMGQRKNILKTGCEIWEWGGGQSLHTKTFLIDDAISVVGSYNLDIRSTRLDTEMMLVVDCPQLNSILWERAVEKTEKSRHVMPDGVETAGSGFEGKEQTFFGKFCSWVLGEAILPFRHLL